MIIPGRAGSIQAELHHDPVNVSATQQAWGPNGVERSMMDFVIPETPLPSFLWRCTEKRYAPLPLWMSIENHWPGIVRG